MYPIGTVQSRKDNILPEVAVRASLQRIFATPLFARSERISRFLRYVADEVLAGREERIKEYTIGVEVYGKGEDFDPKLDATVRVEAGRLRQKLKQYYATVGYDDPVRIELPRGSYVPVFTTCKPPSRERPVGAWWRSRGTQTAAAILLCLLALPAWMLWRGSRAEGFSVAIVPFLTTGGDEQLGRVATILARQLGHSMSHIEGFRIAGPLDGDLTKEADARAIGREYKVQSVLTGSLLKQGDRIRVIARLIDSGDATSLWSETYDLSTNAGFDDEERVADVVARTLRSRFAGNPNPPAVNPEALNLYSQAQDAWLTQKRPGLLRSVELYERAIDRDPRFAKAYAGLASSQLFLANLETPLDHSRLAKAKAAASRAVELDNRLAEAHAILGNIHLRHDWDFAAAEQDLSRALQLQPGVSAYEGWYTNVMSYRRRFTPARSELQIARIINPSSEQIRLANATLYYYAGKYEEAIEGARQAIAITPEHKLAHLALGLALEQKGDYVAAISEFKSCEARFPSGFLCTVALAHANARTGHAEEARRTIARLEASSALGVAYLIQTSIAVIHVGLGEKDDALAALQRGVEIHELDLPVIAVDPRFQPLYQDQRFRKMLEQIGLPAE